jgi:glycosyltransferase involved in cell wall biosynthesis
MAAYNSERHIWDRFVSILTQLATDDEIIIFDDGSTDDIVQAIKGMKNKRIRLFSNPKGK